MRAAARSFPVTGESPEAIGRDQTAQFRQAILQHLPCGPPLALRLRQSAHPLIQAFIPPAVVEHTVQSTELIEGDRGIPFLSSVTDWQRSP
jgi:hypothetical protein